MTTETEIQASLPAQGDVTAVPTEETTEVEAVTASEGAEQDSADPGEEGSTETSKEEDRAEREKEFRRLKRRNEKLLQDRAVERAERERAVAELAELKQARQREDDGEPRQTTEDPREIARQMRLAEKTQESLKETQAEGKTIEGFDKFIGDLVEEVGPLIDLKTNQPVPLLDAVLDFDAKTRVQILKHLGQNTEIALELVNLSPTRIGRRLAQIESELKAAAKPKTSSAPKPLAPVKPSSTPIIDAAKQTDAQWRAARVAQKQSA